MRGNRLTVGGYSIPAIPTQPTVNEGRVSRAGMPYPPMFVAFKYITAPWVYELKIAMRPAGAKALIINAFALAGHIVIWDTFRGCAKVEKIRIGLLVGGYSIPAIPTQSTENEGRVGRAGMPYPPTFVTFNA